MRVTPSQAGIYELPIKKREDSPLDLALQSFVQYVRYRPDPKPPVEIVRQRISLAKSAEVQSYRNGLLEHLGKLGTRGLPPRVVGSLLTGHFTGWQQSLFNVNGQTVTVLGRQQPPAYPHVSKVWLPDFSQNEGRRVQQDSALVAMSVMEVTADDLSLVVIAEQNAIFSQPNRAKAV